MKPAQLLTATSALLLAASPILAGTYNWTGGAGTSDWYTPANWDMNGIPGEADDVTIDGAAVTASGSRRIPSSLTLLNGASYEIGGEIQFGNNGVEHPAIYGGTVSGTLVASQYAGATLTIADAAIIDTGSGNNGFWQNTGSYLDFVDGAERAASFTYQTSIAANPFYFFSNPSPNPYIRYNGRIIDAATFADQFAYTDNGDGTTTLYLKALDGWRIGAPETLGLAGNVATVGVTATKYSGGNATLYFAMDSQDRGATFADWAFATEGVVLSSTQTVSDELTLADGYNYIRAFLLCDGVYTASPVLVERVVAYGDYGALTDVYEYVGTDNNLASASNWVKDKAATVTAPTAGTDIRWFGRNTLYSGALSIHATDRFNGATLALSGDCNISSDVAFTNTTVTIATIVVGSPVVLSLYCSSLTTTRNDQWLGVYPPATYPNAQDKTFVNFLSGAPSSFTFTDNNLSFADAAAVKAGLADPGYIVLDGAPISAADWDEHFTVDIAGKTVTISYVLAAAENRISSADAFDVTSSSATLTAVVGAAEAGSELYLAYGTAEPSGIGTKVADAAAGTFSQAVTGLAEFETYHFTFSIVKDGAVLASKSGSFTASDYDYIYQNGAWMNDLSPNWASTARVLVADDYATGEINPENKVFKDASVTVVTLANGAGPVALRNATLANNRSANLVTQVPYGVWANQHPVDFQTASGNGVIRRGDIYSCYVTADQLAGVYSGFIANGRLTLAGETISQALFESAFTVESSDAATTIEDGGAEYALQRMAITYWEPFPASTAQTDWTIQGGARVKLYAHTRAGNVTVSGGDAVIDLNGLKLSCESLTVNGVRLHGTFTAATLPALLKGAGILEAGLAPTLILIR